MHTKTNLLAVIATIAASACVSQHPTASDMDCGTESRDTSAGVPDLPRLIEQFITATSSADEYRAFRDTLPHGVLPRSAMSPTESEYLLAHRDRAIPILMNALREGRHSASFLLAFLRAEEA